MKFISFYLPQYHPIPTNDQWWGKGFTEWTNVTAAKPLFKRHKQPKLPADLGFYDLRVPEVRQQQSKLAIDNGIDAFCYWHYWFGNGRKVLELPLQENISKRDTEIGFCVAWANESWTGHWHGLNKGTIIEQTYPGTRDIENHFYSLLPAFEDERYFRVDDCPLFIIYKPFKVPDLNQYIDIFKNMAVKSGFKDLVILGYCETKIPHTDLDNLDGYIYSGFGNARLASLSPKTSLGRTRIFNKLMHLIDRRPINIFDYEKAAVEWEKIPNSKKPIYPVAYPNWDNSPRAKEQSTIILNSNPSKFKTHLTNQAINLSKTSQKEKILFIKSWNEWAEGNYLEPDQTHGNAYLTETLTVKTKFSKDDK